MPHQRIEAVRLLINEFRRTRKVRTKPYSETIKEQIVGLLDIDTVPRLAKQLGISNVLIYQWRRELSATKSKIPADRFKLILQNNIAELVESLGYRAMSAEGAECILAWRSSKFIYQTLSCKKMSLLLKNYRLGGRGAFSAGLLRA
jgi:transposase-like protein